MKKCCRENCIHNGELQSLSNFQKRNKSKDHYSAACKDCYKLRKPNDPEKRKIYYQDNLDRFKQYGKNNLRDISIKRKVRDYGISYELATLFYDKLIRCAVCKVGDAVPDHCHTTNKYRGPLCMMCNLAIGCIEQTCDKVEDPEVFLTRLMKYVHYTLNFKSR